MFILRKNVFIITRYSKNLHRSISVLNKPNLFECHTSFQPQFIYARSLISPPIDEMKKENAQSSACGNGAIDSGTSNPTNELAAITKGDKDLEHKLKVIMLETEVLRQDGKPVPPDDFMTPEIWENLLKLPSRTSRTKYLDFLFRTSKKKQNKLARKLEKRQDYEEKIKNREELPKSLPCEEHALKYGLMYNNIFLRFIDTTINHFYNNRLIKAMQFGQKLVIDCGYDQNMTKRENNNTAKQLMLLFSENRNNDDPFDIHFTNVNKESDLTKMLNKYVPTMYNMDFPMYIHGKSYLDLFPKQKLVYLTPHCQEEMETFDDNAIYIVGAIVDKVNNEPISLAKAKREGLTMKKFPLDRYLQWGSGSGKSLTINQCVAILLDMKATGDWKHALRHVPKRKLADTTAAVNNFRSYKSEPKKFTSDNNRKSWKPSNKIPRVNIKSLYND